MCYVHISQCFFVLLFKDLLYNNGQGKKSCSSTRPFQLHLNEYEAFCLFCQNLFSVYLDCICNDALLHLQKKVLRSWSGSLQVSKSSCSLQTTDSCQKIKRKQVCLSCLHFFHLKQPLPSCILNALKAGGRMCRCLSGVCDARSYGCLNQSCMFE